MDSANLRGVEDTSATRFKPTELYLGPNAQLSLRQYFCVITSNKCGKTEAIFFMFRFYGYK